MKGYEIYQKAIYPDFKEYSLMYAKYLQHDRSGEMFNMAVNGSIKDMTILDLCCGGGRSSAYALELGAAKVVGVDISEGMLNPELIKNDKFFFYSEEAIRYIWKRFKENETLKDKLLFDVVICQQAINYWIKNAGRVVRDCLPNILKDNGVFVFNTFLDKPGTKPLTKDYIINGKQYTEIAYSVGNTVNHVQVCEGETPHFTQFDYISESEFEEILSPSFDIERKVDKNTVIYACSKKRKQM